MGEELDRRIAVEVMGERVLPKLDDRELDEDLWPTYSPGGNWWCTLETDWKPHPFSSDLDLAMRAVDRWLEGNGGRWILNMDYDNKSEPPYEATMAGETAYGSTLPLAICNLLLALVEEK